MREVTCLHIPLKRLKGVTSPRLLVFYTSLKPEVTILKLTELREEDVVFSVNSNW